MPSKHRKKLKAFREYYANVASEKKENAKTLYSRNKEAVKCRTAARKRTDKTGRVKNAAATQNLLQQDSDKCEKNRARSRINTLQRLQADTTYKERNRSTARNRLRQILDNEEYRQKNRAATKKRLEEDAGYRVRNRARAKVTTMQRLKHNKVYREQNRARARTGTVKRLQENETYREQNRARARILTQKRRLENTSYRKQCSEWAKAVKRARSQQKQDHCEQDSNDAVRAKQGRHTTQQLYWIRRSRLLSATRRQQKSSAQQKRMQATSSVFLLDVKLLFAKAQKAIAKGFKTIQSLHRMLQEKAVICLDKMSDSTNPNEDDIAGAFGDVRIHSRWSEPYFWEQVYRRVLPEFAIPVDCTGKARLFTPHVKPANTSAQLTDTADSCKDVSSWQCNPDICNITEDMIAGTVSLLHQLSSAKSARCLTLYNQLNKCQNPNRTDSLGHPSDCTLDCNCTSLIRPARLLSCHFPYLRNMVRKIYEARHVAFAISAVERAMANGSFDDLKAAVKQLSAILSQPVSACANDNPSTNPTTECEAVQETREAAMKRCPVDEEEVMNQFAKALRLTVEKRDTLSTQTCDVCEQLKTKLSTLRSYEHRKGFTSEKMTEVIDMLYINKTKHENIDDFLDNTFICSFCADKLRGNKDVAQSAFNRLSVIPTPQCIQQLNVFEKSLIKQCMTSISVIRLGQVSKKKRPATELNSALKGRIAYLPVDVTANSTFLPDNLFNIESLVLLVAAQPTAKQKIWTSVVDLNKVHEALGWLRENKPLYEDVPVYTTEDIQNIIAEKLSGESSTTSKGTGGGLLRKLDEATKSFLYEHFTLQPLSAEYPADAVVDYQLQKVSGQSANIFDTNLDLMAFPELFPTGCNGIKDTVREVKIGTSDYIKSRLLNKDPKFRLNISYLFNCFQTQEVSNMCHSVGHMLRTVTGKNLTAKAFHDRLEARDGEIQTKMFTLLAKLRGSKEYFTKLAMDIRWMIKHLGPPTLFITCSAAEWFSQPLIEQIRKLNREAVPNVDNMTPAELCAMDPVTVSRHFHNKWHSIFTNLINSKDTPLFGPVADYFWRIEYQQRGSAHVHCVLWIEGAPVIGNNTTEEVKEYINKVATCTKPDPATSPTLSQLVSNFQLHKCNSYCQKSYKHNGKFYKKCRFGFPRPEKNETQLNDPVDCLAIQKTKQPRKRLYHLQRRSDEVNVNDYNPALLLANQANVDVQYIGHLGSRLPYYITDYMTKHERSEQDQMWQDIFSSTRSLGTNAMSFLLKSVKSRQVGANEAADRLLGHKLYSKSRQMRFADLEPSTNAKRVLKPAKELHHLLKTNPDCEDIFLPHWVLDIYPARPDELEDTSLHELLGWYERERLRTRKEPLQLKGYDMYLRRRKAKPYIITHRIINPQQSEEKKEAYYYQLLKLFKPWRVEADLSVPGKRYAEIYEQEKDHLLQMKEYHEANLQVRRQEEQTEKDIEQRAEDIRAAQENPDVEDDVEGAFDGCRVDPVHSAVQDVIDARMKARQKDMDDSQQLKTDYNQLNSDQKRIVDKVVHSVCTDSHPLHLVVSGQGGTGKSRVINLLDRMVSDKLPHTTLPVILAAPTGLAAFSIGGTTLHRLLNLPVEHGKPADYSRLQQEQLTLLRASFKGVKLLIIDELSMVSSITLLFVHMRLTEILACNQLFGGIHTVFFADFLQLPPVKGNQPFIPVTFLEAKQRLGAVAPLDIWQMLQYDELTINMRQQGDTDYADLLSNVRVGNLTDDQYRLLAGRLLQPEGRATVTTICDRYHELVADGQTPLILMPRTSLCDEVNTAMLAQIGATVHNIPALDTLDTVVGSQMMKKVEQAYRKSDEDVTRTAGLEKQLRLCVGSKVMLKRNINVDLGLVNGSIGTVVSLNLSSTGSKVQTVAVKFDKIDQVINVERESASFEVMKSVYYTRKQFPLMLAFAITIHKAQGLSLQSAIVDAGATNFGPGMVYVALSRVTSLAGLHLIALDKSKIACDSKAVEEYNRLRQLYTPHLGQLSASSSPHNSNANAALKRFKPNKPQNTSKMKKRRKISQR